MATVIGIFLIEKVTKAVRRTASYLMKLLPLCSYNNGMTIYHLDITTNLHFGGTRCCERAFKLPPTFSQSQIVVEMEEYKRHKNTLYPNNNKVSTYTSTK